MFNSGRREEYRLEGLRGKVRPMREDESGGWRKIMRKFIIRFLHQILKSSPMLFEVNYEGVR
jgi:hypothetical protein